MFEQILKELKTKYKDLGLSESILKAKAKQIEKAVKEESEIEALVEDAETELSIYQSLSDQNRTLKTELENLKKTKVEEPKNQVEKPKEENKEGEEENPMLALLKEMKAELAGFKAEKNQQSTAEKLTAKLNSLGVNEKFYKSQIAGKTFENDEQLNEYADSLKSSYDDIVQEIKNVKLADSAGKNFATGGAGEEKVSKDMEDYLKTKFKSNESN